MSELKLVSLHSLSRLLEGGWAFLGCSSSNLRAPFSLKNRGFRASPSISPFCFFKVDGMGECSRL